MTATTPDTLGCRIRWMITRDLPASLAASAATDDPWSEGDFLACLRRRNCIGMVAARKWDDAPVGFVLYDLHPNHIRLLALAVHPDVRGRGVGRLMADKLAHKCVTHRRERIEATVGELNAAGIAFLRSCGFAAVGLDRGWRGGEDGIEMDWTAGAA
jgi:ribosomal-protein-alanine N-acetyltransferase